MDAVNAEHVAVEPGDVVEDNRGFVHRITSTPRIFRSSKYRQNRQRQIRDAQQHQIGISSPRATRKKTAPAPRFNGSSNSDTHTEPIRWLIFMRCPHFVLSTPLIAAPKPDATKKMPNRSAP